MTPHICPFHKDHHDSIHELNKLLRDKATVEALTEACRKIKEVGQIKLDAWVFKLYVASVALMIGIAATAYGWLAVDYVNHRSRSKVLEANQHIILEHYGLRPAKNLKEAEEVMTNGKDYEPSSNNPVVNGKPRAGF